MPAIEKLSPFPSRDKWPVENGGASIPQPWNRWLEDLRTRVNALIAPEAGTAGAAWSSISKSGSNLTDIEKRNHADLQNLNTANYAHLTQDEVSNLTLGEDTNLHFHAQDRIYASNYSVWVE